MWGFGYKVASKLSSSLVRLLKEHPRVVPLLSLCTFPDTTKFSFQTFAEWVRASSLTNLVPEDEVSGLHKVLLEEFLNPLLMQFMYMRFNTESLGFNFPRSGALAKSVVVSLEDGINKGIKERIYDTEFYRIGRLAMAATARTGTALNLNDIFQYYSEMMVRKDSFPAVISSTVEEAKPYALSKVGKWVRFKVESLSSLRYKGKFPWRQPATLG
jgi:hypothetical protein